MKAAIYHGREDVRVEETEPQSLGPADVRVAVGACGICGSDLHEYAEGPIAIPEDEPHPLTGETLPLTIGHEFAGRVTETGADVDAPVAGDTVVVNPIIGCGECQYCTAGEHSLCDRLMNVGIHGGGGGFAETVVVPAENAVSLPDDLSPEDGALVEPLGVGLHAVRRSGLSAGDTAAVFGAGPIGLAVLQSALAAGAREVYVSEPRAARRELAEQLGATEVVDPRTSDPVRAIKAATDGGTHTAFEVAGVDETLTQAVRTTRKTGTTVVVSVYEAAATLQPNLVMMGERNLVGSYGYRGGPSSRQGEFATVIRMLQDGRLDADPMITGRIGLDDIVEEGFERLRDPESDHVKILVTP
jgi:(R,R)-butanediol dehydrogenase/meso-butanediol dehydrogenase/diacetyl reductase